MPSGAVFITFSFILRAVEGIGSAMYSTASYTLLAELFSEHKGIVVVSQPSFVWIKSQGGIHTYIEFFLAAFPEHIPAT